MSSGIAAKVDVPHAWAREEDYEESERYPPLFTVKERHGYEGINPAMNKPVTEKFSEEKETCIIYLSSQREKNYIIYLSRPKRKKLHNIFCQAQREKKFT